MATRPEYPPAVPERFMPDGTASTWPGNTLICPIPEGSQIYQGLTKVRSALAAHPVLSQKVHLMPPDSWHMTVVDCVSDTNRQVGWWPPGKETQSLDECTRDFAQRLKTLDGALNREGLGPAYQVRGIGFDADNGFGIGLRVEGVNSDEEKRIRRLRDKLADTIGFRDLRHDSYSLHVTICYFLRYIEGDDRVELNHLLERVLPEICVEFDLGPVAFCEYDNLEVFHKLLYVDEKLSARY